MQQTQQDTTRLLDQRHHAYSFDSVWSVNLSMIFEL